MPNALTPTTKLPIRESVGPWTYDIGDTRYVDLHPNSSPQDRRRRSLEIGEAHRKLRNAGRRTFWLSSLLWVSAVISGLHPAWTAGVLVIIAALVTGQVFSWWALQRARQGMLAVKNSHRSRATYAELLTLEMILSAPHQVKARHEVLAEQGMSFRDIESLDPGIYEDFARGLLEAHKDEIDAPYVRSVTKDINEALYRAHSFKYDLAD